MMKLMSTTVLALGALVLAAPVAAQMGGAPMSTPKRETQPEAQSTGSKLKLSSKAGPAIVALQTAVNANDVANIPAKLAAAQAVAQNKDDHYAIGQLQLKAALAAKDNVAASAAVDAIANSGYLGAAEIASLYTAMGVSFYNAKDYARASTAFERAVSISPNNPAALKLLGEAQNAQGQPAQAAATFMRAIQLNTAAGLKPEEDLYKRAVSLAYGANSPTAIELGRQWIAAYPSPESWRNGIAIYRNYQRPDVESTLDLLRLMQAAGALTTAGDYRLFVTAAAEQLNYNEAQAVLDAGIAAKVVNPASAEFRDVVTPLKNKQKATAADLAVATKTAQSGTALIRIGDGYYGMGNYAKAAELYRMSIGKPGVDAAVANLHLGMALARSGDKAGATAAFSAVTGPRSEVAKYWLLYVAS